MKKNYVTFVMFVVIFCCNMEVLAGETKDNFLMIRYESGEDVDNGNEVHGTYNVFENNSLDNWALGFRVITGKNDFHKISLHTFYKPYKGFQVGGKYDDDSLGSELAGPALRYVGVLGEKIFTILDIAQYFDLDNHHDKVDIWLHLSLAKKQGWYAGTEIWYYKIKDGIEKIHYRPIKVGYKFQNGLAPFIMPQFRWDNGEYKAVSGLFGIDIKL